MDNDFPFADVRGCPHDGGVDCDGLFHYCARCSAPLDDCPCPRA